MQLEPNGTATEVANLVIAASSPSGNTTLDRASFAWLSPKPMHPQKQVCISSPKAFHEWLGKFPAEPSISFFTDHDHHWLFSWEILSDRIRQGLSRLVPSNNGNSLALDGVGEASTLGEIGRDSFFVCAVTIWEVLRTSIKSPPGCDRACKSRISVRLWCTSVAVWAISLRNSCASWSIRSRKSRESCTQLLQVSLTSRTDVAEASWAFSICAESRAVASDTAESMWVCHFCCACSKLCRSRCSTSRRSLRKSPWMSWRSP